MEDIDCTELKRRMSHSEKLNVLDVREINEYQQSNIGGQNLPLGTIPHKLADLEKFKEQELIVYCQTGVRSGMAKKYLEQQGFTKVRNLLGGIVEYFNTE